MQRTALSIGNGMTNDSPSPLASSEERLWQLIELRSRPGADIQALDKRIWDLFGERLAVMFTDLSGFSRSVQAFGITHFLQIIHEQKKLLFPIIGEHDGILVKIEADSLLLVFKRVDRALACAVAMQRACQRHNTRRKPEEHIPLCIGIGYGDILRLGETDVYGQEVNAASKLGEDTARADEILVTDSVRTALQETGTLDLSYEAIGIVPGSERNWKVDYRSRA